MSMRLLARDGWAPGALKMTHHVSYESVRRHVCGECSHDHGYAALPNWHGEQPERLSTRDRVPDLQEVSAGD